MYLRVIYVVAVMRLLNVQCLLTTEQHTWATAIDDDNNILQYTR